jgi:hypothetical protein
MPHNPVSISWWVVIERIEDEEAGQAMTHYRYRIQVGDEYTYRDGVIALDSLVQDLLDRGVHYEGKMAECARLMRKARGESVAAPPKPKPVPPEDIKITVEKIPPPPPPEKEKWHKL